MTVKVDEASGVAGFVAPDNHVDVVVTVDKGDYSKNPISKVVFQNLRVLGIGQRIEARPGDKPQVVPTVTLEVTPEEGEQLALAAQEGRISLVLRGQEDARLVSTPGAVASRMFGSLAGPEPAPKAAPDPGPRRSTVEVIRGLERRASGF
jgi:pilus assembly protein CpaB